MREILFRGKQIDNGEWMYGIPINTHIGTFIVFEENPHFCHQYGYMEIDGLCKVVSETVGQYTGLTDENGTKIFEGDIVKFDKYIYQIIYECGSFALYDEQGEMFSKIGGENDHCFPLMNLYLLFCWEEDCAYDMEIIGNIYDNQELLKGDE